MLHSDFPTLHLAHGRILLRLGSRAVCPCPQFFGSIHRPATPAAGGVACLGASDAQARGRRLGLFIVVQRGSGLGQRGEVTLDPSLLVAQCERLKSMLLDRTWRA
jgi:hypothetical protein